MLTGKLQKEGPGSLTIDFRIGDSIATSAMWRVNVARSFTRSDRKLPPLSRADLLDLLRPHVLDPVTGINLRAVGVGVWVCNV